MSRLEDLQRRFQDYLVDGDDSIEQDIVGSDAALAEHRLGVYYNAYRIRLIDSLAIDYAALEKHLGRDAFEQLALDYLRQFPSTSPSVRWFGDRLPEYMRTVYTGDDAEMLRELVEYEQAQNFVFDAADPPRLVQMEDIAQVPPEAWPDLGFGFIPALRWLDLHWNVPLIEQAHDQGAEVPVAERKEHPIRWLLWRREMKTHWRSLDVHEAWAIEEAGAGTRFGAICEGLLEWVDESQVALVAAGFMKQWISDGLLLSLEQ
jgi:hypothetical protein